MPAAASRGERRLFMGELICTERKNRRDGWSAASQHAIESWWCAYRRLEACGLRHEACPRRLPACLLLSTAHIVFGVEPWVVTETATDSSRAEAVYCIRERERVCGEEIAPASQSGGRSICSISSRLAARIGSHRPPHPLLHRSSLAVHTFKTTSSGRAFCAPSSSRRSRLRAAILQRAQTPPTSQHWLCRDRESKIGCLASTGPRRLPRPLSHTLPCLTRSSLLGGCSPCSCSLLVLSAFH